MRAGGVVSSPGSEMMKEAFRKLQSDEPMSQSSRLYDHLQMDVAQVSENLGHTSPSPATAVLALEKKTFTVNFQPVSYFMLISPKWVQLEDLCY